MYRTKYTKSILAFMQYVNNTNNNLKFTEEHSPRSVNFLDLNIFKNHDNVLETLFTVSLWAAIHYCMQKATILNDSKGIYPCVNSSGHNVTAAALRILLIMERGYSRGDINLAFDWAKTADRTSLLSKKTAAEAPSRICFSTEFNPLAGQIKSVILKH